MIDVCKIRGLSSVGDVNLYSDIVALDELHPPSLLPIAIGFPLADIGQPYLCSQASGGKLTHFAHPSTWHAVDLDAPVGTPVLAVADGEIIHVSDSCAAGGGSDASLFFSFNSIVQRLFDERNTTIEYVHIRQSVVSVGERVVRGQRICESGDAGFCPTAHLHIEAHYNGQSDPAAPSVPIHFEVQSSGIEGTKPRTYAPREGARYLPATGELMDILEQLSERLPCGRMTSGAGESSADKADTMASINNKRMGLDSPTLHDSLDEGSGGSSGTWETVSSEHERGE
eukprot:scaffold38859_cov28-Tisochrysis_lutea.AAC.2